ncbi:mucin-2-like isoform X1 [Octopus vulgaris]|uniref:Mucin-2-like isoform X1 n=1 Tax=Octopus vulgaris TaxID=6645 RepID=A0AA36EZ62_OCTVU|nr:mucin-2-like isoform X1 [Octopus vulgaris]
MLAKFWLGIICILGSSYFARATLCNVTEHSTVTRNASCDSNSFLLVHGYKLVTSYGGDCLYRKEIVETSQTCCDGWTGQYCNIPICTIACKNEGTCVQPNKCQCTEKYKGLYCEFNMAGVTDDLKFCFDTNLCNETALEAHSGNLTSIQDCCGERDTGSWGVASAECTTCNFQKSSPEARDELGDQSCRFKDTRMFKTFDGKMFGIPYSKATIKLVEYSSLWSVVLKLENCNSPLQCKKKVEIRVDGKTISTNGTHVMVDGSLVEPGKFKDGISLSTHYGYLNLVVNSIPIKFLLSEDLIHMTPTSILFQSSLLKGLCGNYDHDPHNDFQKRSGVTLTTARSFVDHYKVLSDASTLHEITTSQDSTYPEANAICYKIASFGICTECTVMLNYCYGVVRESASASEAMEIACLSVRNSAFEHGTLNIPISDWRNDNNICPTDCPGGMVYSDCGPACPNFCGGGGGNAEESCDFSCVPGCYCPDGQRYEQGKCITEEQCPCEYNGKKYSNGTSTYMDCYPCECVNSVWQCATKQCPKTCSLIGQNTFTTFDASVYTMSPAACEYTLVQSINTTNDLKISLEFESCSSPFNSDINCFFKLNVKMHHYTISIKPTGYFINSLYQNDTVFSGSHIFVKKVTNNFYFLESDYFSISYEVGEAVYIKLDPKFSGQVLGLCGNFDNSLNNDFTSYNGLVLHKNEFIKEFVSLSCPAEQVEETDVDPCVIDDSNLETATKYCSILEESPVFEECLSVVRSDTYKKLCMRDMCNSLNYNKQAFCIALEAYTRECAENNITIDWQSNSTINDACSITCPEGTGQQYLSCKSSCLTSCHDLDKDLSQCKTGCISGCQCPDGTLMNDIGICVKISECTCYDKHHKKHYENGESVQIFGRDCTCASGTWECNTATEEVICRKNHTWVNNATDCQETCHTLSKPQPCILYEEEYEGCRCPPDYVTSPDGNCVLPSQCPCKYGNVWKPAGTKLDIGCKKLECMNSVWQQRNTPDDCPAECWTSGASHYSTYDGLHYSFESDCAYTFTESLDGTFKVIVRNIECNFPFTYCTKNVELKIFNKTIHFVQGKPPTFDGTDISDRGLVKNNFSVKETEFTYIVHTSIGFTLTWDKGTRLYVQLSEEWAGKVQGLCGNRDQDSTNDFLTRSNSNEKVPSEFAHTWRVNDCLKPPSTLIDACEVQPGRKPWAIESCKVIKYGTVFSLCREVLPDTVVQEYYEDCLHDSCGCNLGGDCECYCTAVANFAKRCTNIGVVARWRNNDRCAVMCDGLRVYKECGSSNPPTCRDKQGTHLYDNTTFCVEGCFCPPGYVEDGEDCIKPDDCVCWYEGKIYPSKAVVRFNNCHNCTCTDGEIVCTNITDDCCSYSEWSSWGACSKTCDEGLRYRHRILEDGNTNCTRNIEEYIPCIVRACPSVCNISDIGFDNSELMREDICEKCYCEGFNETCFKNEFSIIDGNWTEWTEWSNCSDSCQPGAFRQRQRSCSNPLPQCGGKECVGNSIELEDCNTDAKCCIFDTWSFWSSCDQSCGPGNQTRERTGLTGSFCGNYTESEQQHCEIQPCDVTCGEWGVWSECKGDCGKGISTRTFTLSDDQQNNPQCSVSYETKECDLQKPCVCGENEEISSTADCEPKCGAGFLAPNSSECETFNYGCRCKSGLFRNESGHCIPKEDCNLYCYVGDSIKKENEIWIDPERECYTCECIGGHVECQRKCEIPECNSDEELFFPEINPCCPVCKLRSENKCQVKVDFKYLTNGTCTAIQKVRVTQCGGHCAESTSGVILMSTKPDVVTDEMFHNNCECCQAKATKIRSVTVLCPPDNIETVMYYPEICSCECTKCR